MARPWLIAAGGMAALGIAGAVAVGPGAPFLVDWLGDGRSVWRLGAIEIDGVSGAHLGDLRASSVRLRDRDGVYATARDVALSWSPLDLFGGKVAVRLASARVLEIVRAPHLAPQTDSADAAIDVDLAVLQIDRVSWAQGPHALDASVHAALTVTDGAVRTAALHLDVGADRLALDYGRNAPNRLVGRLTAAADGPLMAKLGVAEPLRIDLDGEGDWAALRGAFRAQVSDVAIASGALSLQDGVGRIDAEGDLSAHRATRDLAQRIGAFVRVSGVATQDSAHVSVASPYLDVRVRGPALETWAQASLDVAASTPALSRVAPDVGRDLGGVVIAGKAHADNGVWTLNAQAALQAARVGDVRFAADGPLLVRLEADRVRANWAASLQGLDAPSRRIVGAGRAHIDAAVRRRDGVLERVSLALKGALGEAQIEGDAALSSGRWRLSDMAMVARDWRGAAAGDVTLAGDRVTVTGAGEAIDAPGALRTLVGAAPRLSVRGRLVRNGFALDLARIDGANGRLGLRGRIGETLDLAVESVVRGPIVIGDVALDGEVVARGAISGAARTPIIDVAVHVDAAETPIGAVRDVKMAWRGDGRTGTVQASAQTEYGPASLTAPLVFDEAGWRAGALEALVMGVAVKGSASAGRESLALDLAFESTNAARLQVSGSLRVDDDQVLVNADVADVTIASIDNAAASIRIDGPLSAMAVHAQMTGKAGDEALSAQIDGEAAVTRDAVRAQLNLQGAAGDTPFFARTPIIAESRRADWRADMDLAIGSGNVQVRAHGAGARLDVAANVRDAPLRPVLAIVGERGDGRLNGAVTVNNQTQTVQADAELTATGVVLDRRAPDPVDLAVSGALNGAAARARVTAVSRGGLQAEATFAGPLTWTDAGVTIAPGQSGAVDWRVVGAVDALWAAFGPLDQRVSGAIEGQGRIALTATGWSGEGAARLSNAMLHDSLTGLRLRDGAATVRFNDAGAVIEALSARGVDGGSVNGAGAASGPQAGALSLTLERLRVLDRPDIDATASGSVSFSWAPQTGAIAAGALRLDEVNAAPPRPARLQSLAPVREINRPVARDVTTVAAADRPVRLDLGLTAPGRVFVRGRGLQSEWALDLAVRGDTAHPDLIGQARLLRGDFQLAGRVFTLERGQVQFVGAPGDAVMDIEAERATADLTAMVRVAGTVATPQISVASTPALPREEVLPRILFGRTVADLSPLEAAELAGGLAALSGDTAFDLAGAARALVQLDRLDVRSMEGGFALTGGKYLTPEVYLEVARTSLGGSQAALEWQVRPRLFLVSRFNPQGDARVSIRWRGEDAAPPKPPG